MTLVEMCYELTKTFPPSELFGLTSQLRRAVVSIPTNVAEGHSRRSRQAYAHHISIAIGSQAEVETLLELASRLKLAQGATFDGTVSQARSVGRLLYGLHRALAGPARE
jgi:four helix bundle protein